MRLLVIASLMLSATAAQAAPARSDADADEAARRARAQSSKVTEYDFENDNVSGEALSPDHQPVHGRKTGTHASMIKLRAHFIPQMLQMANDI